MSTKTVVSLVPSLTELLFYLGLKERVVGITKFCFEPNEWYKTKPRVGGTKTVDVTKICTLNPNLIIANKEENDKKQVEELAQQFITYVSDVVTIKDAIKCIEQIGYLTNASSKAIQLCDKINESFSCISAFKTKPKVAYLIWNEPLMVAGGNTFINTMLSVAGFENVFADQERYPTVSENDICNKQPDLIFLSSEPFPFKEKHLNEYGELFPNSKAMLVKGDMFSWYGSRMLCFSEYIIQLRKNI